jgi:hypothetical protein
MLDNNMKYSLITDIYILLFQGGPDMEVQT